MTLIIPGVEVTVVKEVLAPQLAPSGVLGLVGIVAIVFSSKAMNGTRPVDKANTHGLIHISFQSGVIPKRLWITSLPPAAAGYSTFQTAAW